MSHRSEYGPLCIRGPYSSSGLPHSTKTNYSRTFQRKSQSASGALNPSMSMNSFFTRHNPHPYRVRHIKGLLDAPICSVHDEGFVPFAIDSSHTLNARLPPAIPPSAPIIPRPKANPPSIAASIKDIPVWYKNFKEIMQNAGFDSSQQKPQERVTNTAYSRQTGRLNEGLRTTRSRQISRDKRNNRGKQIFESQEPQETMMFAFLSQVLRSDSIPAVQEWLQDASEREKQLISDMIRASWELQCEMSYRENMNNDLEFEKTVDGFDRLNLEEEKKLPDIPSSRMSASFTAGMQ